MKILNFSKIFIFLFFSNLLFASDINREVAKLKLKVSALEEEVDGIKSVIDISNNDKKILKLSKKVDNLSTRVDKLESSIDKILNILSENKSKDKKENTSKIKIQKRNIVKNKIKKMSGRDLFKKGIQLLKEKKYTEARNFFLDSVEKNYKAASSYFYIAETLYYQKRYKEAIVFYKKSIYKYDKPKYLSTLLLHTGISLYKIGDKQEARKFLEATINGFPNSKNAKIANKYLKKL